MRSITVTMWVTLDGVVQGLGRVEEDTRGGFTHSGLGRAVPGRGAEPRDGQGQGQGHAALIDRYTLLICPLTRGSGARLFEGPAPASESELTGSVATTKGVIIAHYARRQA